MSDQMSAGVVDAPVNAGGASDQSNSGGSAGTGSDAPDLSQEGQNNASGSQDFAEGGSANGQGFRQRGPSKLDTIRELRSRIREERAQHQEQIAELRSRFDEFENRFKTGNREQKPSRTFWEAPEEVLDERLQEKLAAMEERLSQRWQETQSQSQQTAEWKQETSEAAKFIQSQKVAPEDEEEIADIIRETPAMRNMRPMDRAKYALYLWREEKGINQDKSGLKARASSVQGAAPANVAGKVWTEAEMERELNKFPQNPKDWTDDHKKQFDALNLEFERAYKEKRVKK